MKEINLSLVGARLKVERKQLGINQAEAADLVGVTREHWGRCERGLGMPGGEVLACLADAGADVRYILTGSRDGPAPEVLTSEERVMLDYFRQASPPVRKAALGALLSAAPAARVGGTHSQHASGDGSIQIGNMGSGTGPTNRRR